MRVRLTPEARLDIDAITDYINERSPTGGKKVEEAIRRTLRLLARWPYSGRKSEFVNIRERTLPGLPYLVLYRISANTVEVIKIFHTSRNPIDKGF